MEFHKRQKKKKKKKKKGCLSGSESWGSVQDGHRGDGLCLRKIVRNHTSQHHIMFMNNVHLKCGFILLGLFISGVYFGLFIFLFLSLDCIKLHC